MEQDKTLHCKTCQKDFIFTVQEQEFYKQHNLENEPQHCKACRDAKKLAARGNKPLYTTHCVACGKEAYIPFKPKQGKPIYCSDCFKELQKTGLI